MLHAHAVGVLLALVAARATCRDTSLQLRSDDAPVGLCLAQDEPPRRLADIGTVEVQADAPDERIEVLLFAETGVGARGARLRAIEASLDAFEQEGAIHLARRRRMSLEHLGDVGHGDSLK